MSEKVGYGKPPKHTRFKKGKSGNPAGRPKGSRNSDSIIEDILNQKILIKEGDKSRKVSVLKASLMKVVERALKQGDLKSIQFLLNRYEKNETALAERKGTFVGSEDILSDYVKQYIERKRHDDGKE